MCNCYEILFEISGLCSLVSDWINKLQTATKFLDIHINTPEPGKDVLPALMHTDPSMNSCSFLEKLSPSIHQKDPALHPTSSTCRNHKVWLLTPSWAVPWYRADFYKRHGQMRALTQQAAWLFASYISSRYHSDLLGINRLNLTLLCSDCPMNHNGRLKFPEVKNNPKRFLDKNILIFLFLCRKSANII